MTGIMRNHVMLQLQQYGILHHSWPLYPFDCKRLYFVQDFEAYFNPVGDAYLMAENSYCYGLKPLTIGRWLRYKLQNDFVVESYHF